MTIHYTEKGYGLHEAISRAGHWLVQCDDEWNCSDDAAVQAIIDGYSLADARAPIVATIKDKAREKILAFLPDWKQSNFNARMSELNEIRFGRVLAADEEAEVAVMRAAWDKAKAIRQVSNVHEVNLLNMSRFEDIAAYDINIGWPA